MQPDTTDRTDESRQAPRGPLYDVVSFAQLHGLTIERALQLIEQHGNEKSDLDDAARKLRAKIASH